MTTESGLVVVDKPEGITSHAVVARVRRLVGTRKVGHAGTLDPMATGVLLVGVNRATRLLGHLALTDKSYDATVRLGVRTDTDDADGEVTHTADTSALTDEQVHAAFAAQVGEIDQVPSAVSAIKVDGRRAYARVRAGEEVVLQPRRVTISGLDVHDIRRSDRTGGDAAWLEVDIGVRCSSGTYIRAIARDAGASLGVGGHLTALRRTAVGPFTGGHTLDELAADFTMTPIDDVARACFASFELDETQAGDVRVGRRVPIELAGLTALFAPDGEFLALYEPSEGVAKAVAVFV